MHQDLPRGSAASGSNSQALVNGRDHAADTDEFKKMVDKSAQNIAAEKIETRGRKKLPRDENGNIVRPGSISGAAAPAASSVSPPAPTPDVSQYLILPLAAISKIPASHLEIPELAFTAEEARICAEACNQLLGALVPDIGLMSPKTAAIISAATVFGSIGFSKVQIYQLKMREKRAAPPKKTEETQPVDQNAPTFPTEKVNAQDFFRNP